MTRRYAEVFETAIAPYIALITVITMASPKHARFAVTPKGAQFDKLAYDWRHAAPNLAVGVLVLASAVILPIRFFLEPAERGRERARYVMLRLLERARESKVGVPALVLWGGGRMAQAADMLGVWKERCERVEGFPVPECGHFIPEEQPAVVIDAILRFVSTQRPGTHAGYPREGVS